MGSVRNVCVMDLDAGIWTPGLACVTSNRNAGEFGTFTEGTQVVCWNLLVNVRFSHIFLRAFANDRTYRKTCNIYAKYLMNVKM